MQTPVLTRTTVGNEIDTDNSRALLLIYLSRLLCERSNTRLFDDKTMKYHYANHLLF